MCSNTDKKTLDSVLCEVVHLPHEGNDIQGNGIRKGYAMFQLDMKSSKSVYEQVIDSIKELVMTGVLSEGSKLPSVRELSRQLTINPNTVQKAFKELERGGYIYTVSGRGTFVSKKEDISADETSIQEVLDKVVDDFKALTYLGLAPEDARERVISEIDDKILNKKK